MTQFQSVLIRNLKRYRSESGLTQAGLAELVGITTGYVAEIESGRKYPSPEMLERLAGALSVRPFRLFMADEDLVALLRAELAYLIAPEGSDAFVAEMAESLRRRLLPPETKG